MTKNESELDKAYLSGLDASLWWGKFSEFLYTTNEGIAVRKELKKDYLIWQEKELGRDPAKGLLEWQVLFQKLFPGIENEEEKKTKGKRKGKKAGSKNSKAISTEKTKKKAEVSPSGIKKPKKIENKPRKIELQKQKPEVKKVTKAKGAKASSGAKTNKEIKFKNIK